VFNDQSPLTFQQQQCKNAVVKLLNKTYP